MSLNLSSMVKRERFVAKPVLLYVGHSYHRRTASTGFLLDLLREHFELSILWNESWEPGSPPLTAAVINANRADAVLFFQLLPERNVLAQLDCRRIFWAPMRDNIQHKWRRWRWLRPSGIRLVNFCRQSHEFFSRYGFESHYVQYWQPPAATALRSRPAGNVPLRIFFWIRQKKIGWPLLKILLGEVRPEKILLRASADPGEDIDLPTPEEIASYRIELITGWLEKPRYLELFESCTVFIAPRMLEGIGQTFLEAMSRGLAVVAAGAPTMNEYLQHGVNGYLYDQRKPGPIDFSRLGEVGAQAGRDAAAGHARWIAAQAALVAFIKDSDENNTSWWWRLRRRWLRRQAPAATGLKS